MTASMVALKGFLRCQGKLCGDRESALNYDYPAEVGPRHIASGGRLLSLPLLLQTQVTE